MTRPLMTLLVLLLATPCAAAQEVDFHTQVAPILVKHCYACHGGEEAKGGFSINTRSLWLDKDAAEPGDGEGSYAIELMREPDPEFAMPPADKPRPTEAEIATLIRWIDQGMAWDEGFTFGKNTYEPPLLPRRPELPPAVDGRDNPIDRVIDAYLLEHGTDRPEALSDAAFYRRLSLDLLGVLPDPDALERFVQDASPNKRAALVDQLLDNDVEYARHWLTFWNDLLRNDYKGTGYIDGGRRSISGWLYRSLLENKPYDQFTRELLSPTEESRGFIGGIKWRGEVNASQTREVQFAQNVGQVFLGINLKCASCHDSFIDRWTLDEAYGLAAVFSEEPLEQYRCDKPTGEMATPKWLFPELGEIDPAAPRDERLAQLAELMTSPDNGRLTRTMVNRLWHRLMGRGIVHPVDAMQTEPWSADLLDALAVYLSDNDYDLKQALRLIATSHAYQSQSAALDAAPDDDGYRYTGPLVKRMTAEQFVDAIRQVTQTQTTQSKLPARQIERALGIDDGPATTRASMLNSDLLQRALGRPNREQVVSDRPQQLTTLQALDLANGEALNTMIKQGASQLLDAHGEKTTAQLTAMVYRRALSRPPTEREQAVCVEILGPSPTRAGVEDLLWSVFMLPEFQHVR